MTAKIVIESGFIDEARRLPPDRKTAAIKALAKFMQERALPSLKFRLFATPPGGMRKHHGLFSVAWRWVFGLTHT